ncbi:MAG TPA: 4-hydroxythreonine-4-phosphate dehydrogenase PdxA [Acetobacteraceae bacterium]
MTRPLVAITMGDPCGIGPEIIAKAAARPETHDLCRPVVVGDPARLLDAARRAGQDLAVTELAEGGLAELETAPDRLAVLPAGAVPAGLAYGIVSPVGGEAAYRCVVRAVELASGGAVAAICTAPLSKEALHEAGHRYPGHTELIAELTATPEVSMMLTTPKLRVIHVTTHVGLLDAVARIEPGLVFRTVARGREALLRLLGREPRIGLCAINPHAGEGGLFGRGEEAEKIAPAVMRAAELGWAVQGPLAADTLFFRAVRGDFDLVVAMYHDQGHGPVKVLGLEEGVNVTVGLPIIRTSVDHGTALDIAGTGKADEGSLIAALRQAALLTGAA